jgi:hypothetical protein
MGGEIFKTWFYKHFVPEVLVFLKDSFTTESSVAARQRHSHPKDTILIPDNDYELISKCIHETYYQDDLSTLANEDKIIAL